MEEDGLLSGFEKREQEEYAEEKCSIFGRLTFSWISPLIKIGAQKTLDIEDLYSTRRDCTSAVQMDKWREFKSKPKGSAENKSNVSSFSPYSLIWSFARINCGILIAATLSILASDVLLYISPMILKWLLDDVSLPSSTISSSISLACLLFIVAEGRSVLFNYQNEEMQRLSVHLQSILTNSILRKTLRLSASSRGSKSTGEILNLISHDVDKMIHAIPKLQNWLSVPFQLVLAMIFLWMTLGPAALAGLIILLIFVPFNYYTSKLTKTAIGIQRKVIQERISVTNEILGGIKVVKLHGWEEAFEKRIMDLRREELRQMRWINLGILVVSAANGCAPFLIALSSFACFLHLNGSAALTPSIVFVSLAIFNELRQPLRKLSFVVSNTLQALVANQHLSAFLSLDEIDETSVGTEADGAAVLMTDASLSWSVDADSPVLHRVNLRVHQNRMIAVVGPVGSGKSSLLSAIIGEMHVVEGSINREGRVGYVPQPPWIFNSTLRENIIYENTYDKELYEKVVNACSLTQDFSSLPNGDMTEIGENGVNLSGGQKARVGLARALYQNQDIYLLDDPFSAVDAPVAKQLFDRVLGPKGILAKKTRILVTHRLNYTKTADEILVMNEGKVCQSGTYDELTKKEGLFMDLIRETKEHEETELSDDTETTTPRKLETLKRETSNKKAVQLIKKEEVKAGTLHMELYWMYISNMGWINFSIFVLFLIIHFVFMMLRSICLSDWSSNNENLNAKSSDITEHLYDYMHLGGIEVLAVYISLVFLVLGSARSSLLVHVPMIRSLMHAPLSFFEETPSGRIISRVSTDQELVDFLLFLVRQAIQSALHVLMIFVLISYSIPAFMAIAIPILIIYVSLTKYFVPTARQLQRLVSVARSPVLSYLGEAIQGTTSIRAANMKEATAVHMEGLVDRVIQCSYLSGSVERWLAMRLDLLANGVIIFTALLGVISSKYYGLSPSLLGVSLTHALSLTDVLNTVVRILADMETDIVSLERIHEYHSLPKEDVWQKKPALESDWPPKGEIRLKDYKIRYRKDLPLVLKGLTALIKGGEKVAIVGRTGSGKSSLAMSLFRVVEAAGGSIDIDGRDIRNMGLHQLRRKIAVIPQDPMIFSGSLRMNLDPFEEYEDRDVWAALDKCQLHKFFSEAEGGLDFKMAEGGKNMSAGERQLLCLGRALLRGGKIVVMDEATASVDSSTDRLVRDVIRKHFHDSTVVTIAHRIHTIQDYDRIMVLENGRIVEFDTPFNLLANPGSHYANMVNKDNHI